MKRGSDKSITPKNKHNKTSSFSHKNSNTAKQPFHTITNQQQHTKAVCPNCNYHFKIWIDIKDHIPNALYRLDSKEKQVSLQQMIQKQFSKISARSFSEYAVDVTPLKIKQQEWLQTIKNNDVSSIDKLKKLNDISQLQKSHTSSNKRFSIDSRLSINQDKMMESRLIDQQIYNQRSKTPSPHKNSIKQSKLITSRSAIKQFILEEDQSELLRSQIYYRFEVQNILQHLISWCKSSQQYSKLPSYLKIIIQNYCQMQDSKISQQ